MPQKNFNHWSRCEIKGQSKLPRGNKFECFNQMEIGEVLSPSTSTKRVTKGDNKPSPLETSSQAPTQPASEANSAVPLNPLQMVTTGPSSHPIPSEKHALAFVSLHETEKKKAVLPQADKSVTEQSNNEHPADLTHESTRHTVDNYFGIEWLPDESFSEDASDVRTATYAEALANSNDVFEKDKDSVNEGFILVERVNGIQEQKTTHRWKWSFFRCWASEV